MDILVIVVVLALSGVICAGIGYIARDYQALKAKVSELGSRGQKRLTHSEVAFYEDLLAILTDIRIREQVEEQRREAVEAYRKKRIEQLVNLLGAARNNGTEKYPTDKPAERPQDY